MKIGDFVSNMAEDRQEVMALYQARHRTTARRRFHATTEAGPGAAKPWKPSQTAACVVGEGSERPGKYSAIVRKLA